MAAFASAGLLVALAHLRPTLGSPAAPLDYAAGLVVIDREVAVVTAQRDAHALEAALLSVLWGRSGAEAHQVALETHRELLRLLRDDGSPRVGFARNTVLANLAITLAEAGDDRGAREVVGKLPPGGFRELLEYAYSGRVSRPRDVELELVIPTESARSAIAARIAAREGEGDRLEDIARATRDRGRGLALRAGLGRLALIVLFAAGLVALALPRLRRRALGTTLAAPPWSVRSGLAAFSVGIAWILLVTLAGRWVTTGSHQAQLLIDLLVAGGALAIWRFVAPHRSGASAPRARGYRGAPWLLAASVAALFALGELGRELGGALARCPQPLTSVKPVDGYWALAAPQVFTSYLAGVAVLAPVAEEILFRVVLYGTLRKRLSFAWAAVLSSAIFGLVHLQGLEDSIHTVYLGLVLAWGYERTGSVGAVIACHGLHNLVEPLEALLRYR